MTDHFVPRSHVQGLLGGVGGELAARIGDLLSEEPSATLRLGMQPADSTRETFALKYGVAQERGAPVVGLDELLNRLAGLGSQEIAACVVQGRGSFGVVVMDPECERVEGLLHVLTTTPE